jgi:hypothetical protein
MRVLISILMATSTLIAFGLYTLRREGPGNALFALFVAVGFFELEVGSFMDDSFFAYPSSGPFRFFWIYPILFILAQIYLCESREPRRRWVRLGYGTWMLGCLWSAESAIYVSCAWLPALAVSEFIRARSGGGSVRGSIVAILRAIGAAVILALGVAAVMSLTYVVGIHHIPDWFEFIEFGVKYAGGLVRATADPYGSIWLIIFELAAIMATAVLCARVNAYRALPLLLGAWGAVWASASYYMARSVNNNINTLLSLAALVVGVLLLVGDRELKVPSARVLRVALMPILVWGLMLSYGNVAAFARMHLPFTPGYDPSEKATLQPAPPDVGRILALAHAGPDTSIQYVDSWAVLAPIFYINGRSVFEPRPWIPSLSSDLFSQLPPDRQVTYIERFESRYPRSGWLLSSSPVALTCANYLPVSMDGRRVRSGAWQMLYCRAPVIAAPVVARPHPIADADATLYGSLDESYFDGTPTFQTATAPIQVGIGREFDVRGWLVNVNASPFRGSIIATVDGKFAGKAVYGDPRRDVLGYMHKLHAGAYSTASGFHIPIVTKRLRPGLHSLQLYAVSPNGRRSALGTDTPFGAY